MDDLWSMSDERAIIVAAHFCTESDLDSLGTLTQVKRNVLTPELLYSLLLTFYSPEDETLSALTKFLTELSQPPRDDAEPRTFKTNAVKDLSEHDAEQEFSTLVLRPVGSTSIVSAEDSLTSFLVALAHHQESINELSPSILALIDNFVDGRDDLRIWRDSCLLPTLRLQYEYYPETRDVVSLSQMERLHGETGIATLLEHTVRDKAHTHLERDLDNVVAPWIRGANKQKRRRLSVDASKEGGVETSWQDLNQWILTTSLSDFTLATGLISQWDGPHSEEHVTETTTPPFESFRYAQTAIAVVYATPKFAEEALTISQRIVARAAHLAAVPIHGLQERLPDIDFDFTTIRKVSQADMLRNALLRPDNALTKPTKDALEFLRAITCTERLLLDYKLNLCLREVADICLFGSEERQKQELSRVLQQVPKLTSRSVEWPMVRQDLLWMRVWHSSGVSASNDLDQTTRIGFLKQVDVHWLEIEVLRAILSAGSYNDVVHMYINASNPPLPSDELEEQIVATIFQHYDNATNGNRTRGGMKRALEMLQTFQGHFEKSVQHQQIDHLIRATHSLSFYQLTLHRNAPCLPVNIRVHKDPISLIGKVLEQNRSAYANLDDLLNIGRNLAQAGLPTSSSNSPSSQESLDSRLFHVQHRITYMAITSALSFHDFDTAYSYITTRLSTAASNTRFIDDTSWRAAYAAGKYRPPPSADSQPLHSRITSLQKRMDLLSLALSLAPTADQLPEILGTWRRDEEELENLKSQAVEEERAFEASSNTSDLPGGFGLEDRELDASETKKALANRWSIAHPGSGPSYEEVLPIGLFDVARGAADALRRSAFPLRSGTKAPMQSAQQHSDAESIEEGQPVSRAGGGQGQRVRKRDMVADAVTGGLVTGMSWVLGAQPMNSPGSAGSGE